MSLNSDDMDQENYVMRTVKRLSANPYPKGLTSPEYSMEFSSPLSVVVGVGDFFVGWGGNTPNFSVNVPRIVGLVSGPVAFATQRHVVARSIALC